MLFLFLEIEVLINCKLFSDWIYHTLSLYLKLLVYVIWLQVDESVTSLDRRVPPVVKQVSVQAYSVAREAPGAARAVVSEVHNSGVKETASGLAKTLYTKCEPKAKELYSKYEPKAEQCAVTAWRKLNQLPLFPQVAHVVVPTAAYCSEKYNQTVLSTAEKGYRVSSYLPLVPTERIAKVFSDDVVQSPECVSSWLRDDDVLKKCILVCIINVLICYEYLCRETNVMVFEVSCGKFGIMPI